MATLVMTTAVVKIGGVDLSAFVKSVTLSYKAEGKETTAMGVGSKQRKAGLIDWSLECEMNQDFAALAVSATIFPLIGTSDVAIAVKPTNAITSALNPDFRGVGVITDYSPLDAAVGEVSTTKLKIDGSGVLTMNST